MKNIACLSFALISLQLSISCLADDMDGRSDRDEQIGKLTSETYQFSTQEGTLNVVSHDANNLKLRAGSPEFSATVTNSTEVGQNLKITISNVSPETVLQSDGAELAAEDTSENLTKSWTIDLNASSQVTLATQKREATEFQFIALGDIQDGIDEFAQVTQRINEQQNIDFVLFLGDLTMNARQDQFQKVEDAFEGVQYPIFSTPGNHDVSSADRYQDFFGRATYSWEYKGTVFTSVDSASWTLSQKTWQKYKDWLEKAKDKTHIVFSHIAPTESFGLRGGHWRSRREANSFVAHSSRGGVDAMFYGHLHTLDIFNLAGIPVYISGGAGAFQEFLDGIERHFLKARVNPSTSEIDVSVVRVD